MREEGDAVLPLRPIINHKEIASAVLNKTIEAGQPHLTEPAGGDKEKPKAGVKEVVMLQCSSILGDNFTLTADIVRNEGIKPALKAWVRMENDRAEGRFIFDVTPLAERQ